MVSSFSGDVDCHWKLLSKAQVWKSCSHDGAAEGVAGGLSVGSRLLHDGAAEGVARSLLSLGGLGHDSAAKRVAGGLGGGVLGGRHFEGWG